MHSKFGAIPLDSYRVMESNVCRHKHRSDDLYHACTFEWEPGIGDHNSSLEGATKLKFAPFCSSRDALSYGILFGQSQNFQILAKNHGL